MSTKESFREKLCQLPSWGTDEPQIANDSRSFMKAFLDYGSETPDNLICFEHIEFGKVSDQDVGTGEVVGLKLKNKPILLSTIANAIECLEFPKDIPESEMEYFPDISKEEWDAATRMMTMVLTAFEDWQKPEIDI